MSRNRANLSVRFYDFSIAGVQSGSWLPNTACTPLRHALPGSQGGLVGVGAFSGSFMAWSWFRQGGVVSSRPPAGTLKGASQTQAANCNDIRYTFWRQESSKIRLKSAFSDDLDL